MILTKSKVLRTMANNKNQAMREGKCPSLYVIGIEPQYSQRDIWDRVQFQQWGEIERIHVQPVSTNNPTGRPLCRAIVHFRRWYAETDEERTSISKGKYLKCYYNETSYWKTYEYDPSRNSNMSRHEPTIRAIPENYDAATETYRPRTPDGLPPPALVTAPAPVTNKKPPLCRTSAKYPDDLRYKVSNELQAKPLVVEKKSDPEQLYDSIKKCVSKGDNVGADYYLRNILYVLKVAPKQSILDDVLTAHTEAGDFVQADKLRLDMEQWLVNQPIDYGVCEPMKPRRKIVLKPGQMIPQQIVKKQFAGSNSDIRVLEQGLKAMLIGSKPTSDIRVLEQGLKAMLISPKPTSNIAVISTPETENM